MWVVLLNKGRRKRTSILSPSGICVRVMVQIVLFLDWSVNQKDLADLYERRFRLKISFHCSSIYMVCNHWMRNLIKTKLLVDITSMMLVCIVVVNKRRQETWNSSSSSSFSIILVFSRVRLWALLNSHWLFVDKYEYDLSLVSFLSFAFFLEQSYSAVAKHNFWSDATDIAWSWERSYLISNLIIPRLIHRYWFVSIFFTLKSIFILQFLFENEEKNVLGLRCTRASWSIMRSLRAFVLRWPYWFLFFTHCHSVQVVKNRKT